MSDDIATAEQDNTAAIEELFDSRNIDPQPFLPGELWLQVLGLLDTELDPEPGHPTCLRRGRLG